jgi:hypothetical protein
MPSVPPPADPRPTSSEAGPEDESSFLVRFGSGIGAALVAAAVAVLPAALRLNGDVDASALQIWTALLSLEVVPMIIAVLVLREARVGMRAFAGPDAGVKAVGVVVWLLLLFAVLVPLGAVLTHAHQRALAGVTYAIGAVVVALGLAVVCGRATRIVCGFSPAGRRAAVVAAVTCILLAVVLAAFRLSRSAAVSGGVGSALVDVLAFVLGALFASRAAFADRPRLAVVGPPAAAILVVIGISALRGPSSTIAGALPEHAPAFGPLADVVCGAAPR